MTTVAAALIGINASPSWAMPGPNFFNTGFAYESSTPQGTWPQRAGRLGSTWFRLAVPWAGVAPSNPQSSFKAGDPRDVEYHFQLTDYYVRRAVSSGQQVIFMVLDAPRWAEENPPHRFAAGSWRPNPHALGAFVRALAIRFSGRFPDPLHPSRTLPRVSYFQIWNEPNGPWDFQPQWGHTRSGATVPASPVWYRGMLNAAYANIKAVQPHAKVMVAGLAPYGDQLGGFRMTPAMFLREMLCLHGEALVTESCPHPAQFDLIDVHPYAPTPTIHAANADDVRVTDLGKLGRILGKARQTHRELPVGHKPIWVTEIGWQSNPPDGGAPSLSRQANYLPLVFYELWRQGVGNVCWFLLRDLGGPPHSYPAMGVYFANGHAKPSARAFRFPFVAALGADGVITLWGKAPAPGLVSIELGNGHGWSHVVARIRTTRNGVFYARRRLGRHLVLRAALGNFASHAWATWFS